MLDKLIKITKSLMMVLGLKVVLQGLAFYRKPFSDNQESLFKRELIALDGVRVIGHLDCELLFELRIGGMGQRTQT